MSEEQGKNLLGEYPPQDDSYPFEEDLANEVWGTKMDVYPLRDTSEDPRWAIRTVWIWVGFDIFCLVFILTLIILGLFF